jgi:hypothetical protein
MDKEKLIKEIMKDLECTREEAEEVAEMEIKAKGIKRYEKAEEQKPRKKREVKLDEDKVKIINFLERVLTDSDALQVEIKNAQKEITFKLNGADYSLTLTKHRPPKK